MAENSDDRATCNPSEVKLTLDQFTGDMEYDDTHDSLQTICGNEEISTEIVNKERSDVPLTECDDTDRDIQTSFGTEEFSAEIVNVKTKKQKSTQNDQNYDDAKSDKVKDENDIEFNRKKTTRDCFMLFLEKINFPQKLTIQDALLVHKVIPEDKLLTDPKVLMNLIIQKIMMSNYTLREVFLHEKAISDDDDGDDGDDSDDSDDSDDDDDDADNDDDDDDEEEDDSIINHYQIAVHPMDVVFALFHCADDLLRQDLYAKLSACQLAVPLLLPNPVSNSIVFPLWGMRSIVKSWKCRDQSKKSGFKYFEKSIIEHEAPLVSFVQFSQPVTHSKSKILNYVITKPKRNIFFNNECKGSSVNRTLDGVVEVSWYLPSGEKSDLFNDVITFANLRGNASNHEKQFEFLIAHSNICVVFLQKKDIKNKNTCQQLAMFSSASRLSKVLFVADKWSRNKETKLKKILPPKLWLCLNLKGTKELQTFASSVQEIIIKEIGKMKQTLCNLSQVSQNDTSISIDEIENTEISHANQLANDIMRIIEAIPSTETKQTIVPLQGPDLWQKWANLNKKQKRMKFAETEADGIEEFFKKKQEDKQMIRKTQLQSIENLSGDSVMYKFIKILSNEPKNIKKYFLQWLKIKMDAYSRNELLTIQIQCQKMRSLLQEENQANKQQLEHDLQKYSTKLIHSSFGVEHLFRELGQIYEAALECTNPIGIDVHMLSSIVAELLLSGHPFEILDGDAGHVPLTWVTAVFKELSKLLDNCRVLVLSIIGIQSTGKSTLLNTIFGVKFAVSAGRCTRGAYCQLLQLDSEVSKETNCDYILILDTEGLRTQELDALASQQHDNELATFVIGLADVTIINMSGEVPADIDDILQTTVHAFLHMKEVTLKPSCVFVRQNVASVTDNKLSEGDRKFLDKLDKTTEEAAKAEHCESKYKKFRDVINFDPESNIFVFPSLWEGNPPMAPVNPAYCDASLNLKTAILSLCKSSTSATLSQFTQSISNIWEALLKENFLFSFKNTLEIEACNILDAEYNSNWSWRLQRIYLKWEMKAKNSVESSEADDLDDVERDQVYKINFDLDAEHKKIIHDFYTFIHDSTNPFIISKQSHYKQKIITVQDDYKEKAKKKCNCFVCKERAKITINKINSSYRQNFKEHLKELVSKKDTNRESLNDEELGKVFDNEWSNWMEEIAKVYPLQPKQNLKHSIEKTVWSKFSKDDHFVLHEELEKRPLTQRGQPLKFILSSDHLIQSLNVKDVEFAQDETSTFLTLAESYLSQDTIIVYDDLHIHDLVNIIMEAIEQSEAKVDFNFTNLYRINLILEVAGYALRVFEAKQEENYANHPLVYMSSLKDTYQNEFSALCKQTNHAILAAINLCKIVEERIYPTLQNRIVLALVDDLASQAIFSNKKQLKGVILSNLLNEEKFDLFKVYLTNVSESYRYWISKFTQEHCHKERKRKQLLTKLAEDEFNKLIDEIKAVTDNIGTDNIKKWLSDFHDHLKEVLPLRLQELYDILIDDECELSCFIDEFKKRLDLCMKDYLISHPQVIDCQDIASVIIQERIAGCCEQCPFCKEQCDKSIHSEKYEQHYCTLHRPECLGGYHWIKGNLMCLTICTDSVGSDETFTYNKKQYSCRNYQEAFPDWNIPNQQNQIAPYWKWFIVRYQKEISEHFNYKVPRLPADWKHLTKVDANDDILKRFFFFYKNLV